MIKGISPLVATVLLIAITMSLAGILAFWGASFVKSGLLTEEAEKEFRRCTGAVGSLKVDFSFYNESTKSFFISIYNSGNAKLKLMNITFFYPTASVSKSLEAISQPGTSVSFLLNEVEPGFLKYIIYTDCPGVVLER